MNEAARIKDLEKKLLDPSSECYIEGLLDVVAGVVADCDHPAIKRNKQIESFLRRYDNVSKTIQGNRLRYDDFALVKVIGQGAFGQVQLVRHKASRKVFALKVLNKTRMLDQTNSAFFWEEREIMAKTTSEWLVKLHYAFVDNVNLYMCMDYMPGGDLVNWLTNMDEISEEQAQFYVAELVLALEALHSMGFIHRDIKPENLLLDINGHVKLADFGTCIRLGPEGIVHCSSAIGTPDYISPEMLMCQDKSGKVGPQCDWWAVGIVLYEMLFGETAFYGESLVMTYGRIMNFKTSLSFPEDLDVTAEAVDIIKGFLSDATTRLGAKGADEVKAHPFFATQLWKWDTIRESVPPFVPDIASDTDTSNFDEVEEDRKADKLERREPPKYFTGENLTFSGFTFNRDRVVLSSYDKAVLGVSQISFSEKQDGDGTLQRELNGLTAANVALKTEKAALEKEKTLAEIQLKDVERKFAGSDQEIHRLNKQVKQSMHVLSEERKGKELLRLDCEKLNETITQLKRKCSGLQDNLDEEHAVAVSLKERLAEKDNQIEFAEVQQSVLTQRVREANNAKCEIEQELLGLVQELEDERDASKTLRDKEKTANKKVREIENDLDILTSKFNQVTKELGTSSEGKKILETKVEELTGEIEKYRILLEEAARMGQEQPVTGDASQDVEEKYERERNAKVEIEKKNAQLKKDYDTMRLSHQDLESKLSSKDFELDFKLKEIGFVKKELEEEKQRSADHDIEISQLTSALQAQKTDILKLKAELSEVQKSCEVSTAQLCSLKEVQKKREEEISDLKDQVEAATHFSDLYKSKAVDMEESLDQLRKKFDDISKEHEALKVDHGNVGNELKLHKSRLDEEQAFRKSAESQLSQLESTKAVMELDFKSSRQTLLSELESKDAAIAKLKNTEENYVTAMKKLSAEISEKHVDIITKETEISSLQDTLAKLERELAVENKKVVSAVNKLNEVIIQQGSYKMKKSKRSKMYSTEEYQQMEKKLKNMENEYTKKEKQYQDKIETLKKELSDKNALLADETEKCHNIEAELKKSTALVSELYEKLDASLAETKVSGPSLQLDTLHEMTLEGVVDMNMKGRGREKIKWIPRYAVVKPFAIFFFNSREEREGGTPAFWEIPFSKIVHVREVNQVDVHHAKPEDIPKIFQIFYDVDRSDKKGNKHQESEGIISWQGHSFQSMRYRVSTLCDACNRVCSDLLNPPPALECVKCRTRIHFSHVESHQKIPVCNDATNKTQFLRVDSLDEKKKWIKHFGNLKEVFKSSDQAVEHMTYHHRGSVVSLQNPVTSTTPL